MKLEISENAAILAKYAGLNSIGALSDVDPAFDFARGKPFAIAGNLVFDAVGYVGGGVELMYPAPMLIFSMW